MAMKVVHLQVQSRFLEPLRRGLKKLEIRTRIPRIDTIKVGDIIEFEQGLQRKVVAIYRYSSFDDVLDNHSSSEIFPGFNRDQILHGLRQIYTRDRELSGVIVFELGNI